MPPEHIDTQTHSSGLLFCGLTESYFIYFVYMPRSCGNKTDDLCAANVAKASKPAHSIAKNSQNQKVGRFFGTPSVNWMHLRILFVFFLDC